METMEHIATMHYSLRIPLHSISKNDTSSLHIESRPFQNNEQTVQFFAKILILIYSITENIQDMSGNLKCTSKIKGHFF